MTTSTICPILGYLPTFQLRVPACASVRRSKEVGVSLSARSHWGRGRTGVRGARLLVPVLQRRPLGTPLVLGREQPNIDPTVLCSKWEGDIDGRGSE